MVSRFLTLCRTTIEMMKCDVIQLFYKVAGFGDQIKNSFMYEEKNIGILFQNTSHQETKSR